MKYKIPISAGEIIDRITILEIKVSRVKDPKKIILLKKELNELSPIQNKILSGNKGLKKLKIQLYGVNNKLWNIENSIRKLEAKKDFGERFIELARSVYINNDKRGNLKNKINLLAGSIVSEIKEYTSYN